MAANVAYLEAVVGADISDFNKGMDNVEGRANRTAGVLGGLGDFGKSLTMGLTLPLLGAGAAIAKIGMEFDGHMRNINSLVQLGEKQFAGFSDQVNKFGSETTYGSNKVAEALYNITSAGIGITDTAEAMDMLMNTVKLAESGRDDLDRTNNAMIALHGTFGLVKDDMGQLVYTNQELADITAAMVQAGVGEMNTYTQNLAKALPAAINLGIGYEELAGSIALLSRTYGNGSKPMTAMGMLMSNLMKPTEGLAGAYGALGVTTGTELIAKFGGLNGAIQALKGTMDTVDFQKSFSKTGFEAVLLLTNDIGETTAMLNTFYASIGGSVDRAWEEQMKSFGSSFDRAKASIEGVAITLSQTLLPLMVPIFDGVTNIANAFINADPALQRMTVVFGMLAAAAGPVIWLGSMLIGSFSPVGLLLKGVAAGAAMASTNFLGFTDTLTGLATGIVTTLKPLGDMLDIFMELASYKFDPAEGGANLPVDMSSPWAGVKPGDLVLEDPAKFLKVEKPTALYDIYVKEGYDKQFSWSEFMKKAVEGGWKKGTAVNPMDKISIDGAAVGQSVTTAATNVAGIIQSTFPNAFKQGMGAGGWFGSGEGLESLGVMDFIHNEKGLEGKLKVAAGQLWKNIETQFGEVWNAARGWFDTNVGAGLDWFGKLFSGTEANGGNTGVYTAVKALLEGNIYAAMDAIIPGSGTYLQNGIGADWGTKIGQAFPKVKAGLATLGTKFGEWFENDAIPTVARSIGFFAGKVGVLIGQAVGAIGGFLTGSGEGVDGGDVVKGFRDTATLVGEGFQEALTGAGVGVEAGGGSLSSWANQIVTGITGALGTAMLAVGVFDAFKNGLWHGIGAAMELPKFFGVKALGMAKSIALNIAGKLGLPTTFAGISTAISTGIAKAIAFAPISAIAIGSVIVTAAVTAIWMQIPNEVKASLQKQLQGVITDVTGMSGAGEAVSRGLERGLYWAAREKARVEGNEAGVAYFDGLIEEIDKLQDAWKGKTLLPSNLNDLMGGGTMDWNLNGLLDDGGFIMAPEIKWDDPSTWERYKVSLDTQLAALFDDVTYEATFLDGADADKLWSNYYALLNEMQAKKAMIPIYAEWYQTGKTPAQQFAEIGVNLADKAGLGGFITLGQMIFKPEGITVDANGVIPTVTGADQPIDVPIKFNFAAAGEGRVPEGITPNMAPVNANTIVSPTLAADVTAALDTTNMAVDTGMTNISASAMAFVNDGSLDAERVETEFLLPLKNYWNLAFGETGVMTTASKTFSTGFITGMDDAATSLTDLNTKVTTELPLYVETFTLQGEALTASMNALTASSGLALSGFATNFQTTMSQVALYIGTVVNSIKDLMNNMNTLGTMTPGMTPATVGGAPLPSHKTGLDAVPYDGYVAELHKDEKVLTAPQAKAYDAMQAVPRTPSTLYSPAERGGSIDNSQTVLNFQVTANSFDDIIKEAKRRGYQIGNNRR